MVRKLSMSRPESEPQFVNGMEKYFAHIGGYVLFLQFAASIQVREKV